MKNLYLVYLIALAQILFFSSMYSEISFTEIKGLYTSIKEDKIYLSPLHGFNWWKLGGIENMYRYGDDADKTIQLIKDLFILQHDSVTFDITTLGRKPANYFTVRTIAKILNVIENYLTSGYFDKSKEEDLFNEMVLLIRNDISLDELTELVRKTVSKVMDDIKELPVAETLKGKSREELDKLGIKERVKELRSEKLGLNKKKNKSEQDLNRAKEIDAIIEKIEKGERAISNKSISISAVEDTVKLIIGSLKESGDIYPQYMVHQILLAFAFKKSSTKKDFEEYFKQFNPGIAVIDSSNNNWSKQQFTSQDYNIFIDKKRSLKKEDITMKGKLKELLFNNYELASFAAYAGIAWGKFFPKIIESRSSTKYTKDKNVYEFSDCGETSIRNFFNIFSYSKGNLHFDLGLLNSPEFKFSQALVDYYKNYNLVSHVATDEYYDKWSEVVSGLEGVNYLHQPGYEINAGLSNMLKVLNHLMFSDDKKFLEKSNKQKLDTIVQLVSRENLKVTWSVKGGQAEDVDKVEKDNDITLNFKIVLEGETKLEYQFQWEFLPNHFILTSIIDPSESLEEDPYFIGRTKEELDYLQFFGAQSLKVINLIGWYMPSFKQIKDQVTFLFSFKKDDFEISSKLNGNSLFAFVHKLNDAQSKIELIKFFLEVGEKLSDTVMIKIIESIGKGQDRAIQPVLDSLKKYGDDYYESIFKGTQSIYGTGTYQSAILARNRKLYQYITPEIIENNAINPSIIAFYYRDILNGDLESFYKNITKKLVDKVANNFFVDISKLIINKNLKKLYKVIDVDRLKSLSNDLAVELEKKVKEKEMEDKAIEKTKKEQIKKQFQEKKKEKESQK